MPPARPPPPSPMPPLITSRGSCTEFSETTLPGPYQVTSILLPPTALSSSQYSTQRVKSAKYLAFVDAAAALTSPSLSGERGETPLQRAVQNNDVLGSGPSGLFLPRDRRVVPQGRFVQYARRLGPVCLGPPPCPPPSKSSATSPIPLPVLSCVPSLQRISLMTSSNHSPSSVDTPLTSWPRD